MTTNTLQAQQDLIKATCSRMVEQQVIEPLSTDEEETKLWNLRELAARGGSTQWPEVQVH